MAVPSKIHLFQLVTDSSFEKRIFEDLHDGLSGHFAVPQQLLIGSWLLRYIVVLDCSLFLKPGQKSEILLLGFEGIKDIGGLTEEAIDWCTRGGC